MYFSIKELECKCCNKAVLNPELLPKLEKLREMYGNPIKITSGYRCSKHNKEVGGVSNSRHLMGQAVDIPVAGKEARKLVELAILLGFGGIGIAKTFVHLDVRPLDEATIWSY